MASMWMESEFKPRAGLEIGNYIGLHQLSKENIFRLWGTRASSIDLPQSGRFQVPDINSLSPEARRAMLEKFAALGFSQIDVVGQWLRGSIRSLPGSVKCRSFDQLRLVGFGGVGISRIDKTQLDSKVASGNPKYDLNKDKKIDVAEFRTAVYDLLHEQLSKKTSMSSSDVRHLLG